MFITKTRHVRNENVLYIYSYKYINPVREKNMFYDYSVIETSTFCGISKHEGKTNILPLKNE